MHSRALVRAVCRWAFLFASVFLLTHTAGNAAEPKTQPQLVIDSQGFQGASIKDVAISPDAKWLAAAGGKEVRVWNLETGELHATLRGYRMPEGYFVGIINDVEFSPGGGYLLVGVSDNSPLGSTRVYDLNDLTQIHTLLKGQTGCTRRLAFSPSGKYVAGHGCGNHLVVHEWSEERGDARVVLDGKFPWTDVPLGRNPGSYFGFPTGSDDIVVMRSQGVQFLAVSVSQQRSLQNQRDWPPELRNMLAEESRVTIDSDSKFTTDSWVSATEQTWCLRGGVTQAKGEQAVFWAGVWKRGNSRPVMTYRRHDYNPTAVTYSPATGLAASADSFGVIHVWDATTGLRSRVLRGVNHRLYDVEWASDTKIRFATRNHLQEQYHFNHYGTPNYEFDLRRHRLEPYEETTVSKPLAKSRDPRVFPRSRHPATGEEVYLSPERDKKAKIVPRYDFTLVTPARNEKSRIDMASHGRPMSFSFYRNAPNGSGLLPCFVGTETGKLLQLADDRGELKIKRELLGHGAFVTSIRQSPNGELLATAATDGTIRIWRLKALEPVGDIDFVTDGNYVREVPRGSYASSATGRGVAEGDRIIEFDGGVFYERTRKIAAGEYKPGDKVQLKIRRNGIEHYTTVRLGSAANLMEPILTLFLTRDDQWALWTPEGYYASSSEGSKFVGFLLNGERHEPAQFYTVGQFDRDLNRPDIVEQALDAVSPTPSDFGFGQFAADRPEAPRTPHTERSELEKIAPPRVRIEQPLQGETVNGQAVKVVVAVTSPRDLQSVDLRLNGRPAKERLVLEGRSVRNGTTTFRYSQTMQLRTDTNTIAVRAEHDRAKSNYQEVRVTRTADARPRLFVLAMGISDFENDALDLPTAAADATAVAKQLETLAGTSFSSVEKRMLLNEQATNKDLAVALQWLKDSANQPTDVAIVALFSRGLYRRDNGDWHLCTYDTDPSLLEATAFSAESLRRWCDRLIAARLIMLTDTRHGLGQPIADNVVSLHPHKIDHWKQFESPVLAATSAREYGKKSAKGDQGAFAAACLTALKEGVASDARGSTTFAAYAARVEELVRSDTDKEQNPVFHRPKLQPEAIEELVIATD